MGLDKHQAKNQKSIVKETYNFVPLIALLKLINNQDHLVIFDVDDVLSHQHRHNKQVLVELGIKLHKILTMALTAIGTGKLKVIEKILDNEYIMLELTTSILKVTQC